MTTLTDEQVTLFAKTLMASQHLVVSTGAGISKESGIPTFRDAMDGLWAKYNPEELATPAAFQRNPKLVWDWYQYRLNLVEQAKPNAGHHALVDLEKLLPKVTIITQNVDGFHLMVGSSDVVCLHGNIREFKCFNDCQGKPTLVDITQLAWDKDKEPPTCPYCQKAYVRPNVVWFNETLPPEALRRASTLAQNTDVMLVIGTSGMVQPAASLPYITKQMGGKVLEINPNPSEITPLTDHFLAAPSGIALPLVVEKIRQLKN
jgi:NAD-dependent deacetylase